MSLSVIGLAHKPGYVQYQSTDHPSIPVIIKKPTTPTMEKLAACQRRNGPYTL
jgi:hypothetical protein